MLFSGTSRRKFPPVADTLRSGHLLRVPPLAGILQPDNRKLQQSIPRILMKGAGLLLFNSLIYDILTMYGLLFFHIGKERENR